MLYTILQIIAIQALFLLVYDLFLKRETFFNYNRAYLLITSLLSFVLPFIKFPELKKMTTNDVVIQLPEIFIGTKAPTVYEIQIAEQAGIVLEQPQTPIWQSILFAGIAIAMLIFIFKITKLYWLKHKNPKYWQGNVLIVKLIKSSAAFSFFNTIFLGERIRETEKPTIYKHELVHIKELHTLDLLYFELLRIVFWFNPLIYIYQNRIKELHEYIADAKAVKHNGKAEYYQSLLNQVFDVNNVSFINTFFKKSLIKKRIAMLQKSKSKQLNLIKYTLLIPMVFGMLIYTSTEVRAHEKSKQEQSVSQDRTDKELIKQYFDKMLAMKKNGATFFEIAQYAGIGIISPEKYLVSKEEFLKSKAYMQYVADDIIARNSENGTLTEQNLETAAKMTRGKNETYLEYKEWKKTDEAKEHWESYSRDGVFRFFVKEMANQTENEIKLLDGLLKQLERGDFQKIMMSDGKSTFVIDSYESSNSDKNVEEIIEVPFSVVEVVPTLKECQDLTDNVERKKCMTQFVNKHVAKKFNTDIANNLKPGKKRIFVQFKIDTEGNVKDINARAPTKELEDEAKRVLRLLPQFVPGKQKGKLVTVPFSLPIVFQVQGDENDNIYSQNDSVYSNKIKNKLVEHLSKEIRKKDSIEVNKIPFNTVEITPVHPDCTSISSESDKKDCTNHAVNKHIGKNFQTNLAKSLDLPAGKQRIFTQFVIDKKGNITNIKVRGAHPKLEEEVVRVLKLLPQFTPGMQDGKIVNVPFSIPIVFSVAEDLKKD